MHQKDKKLFVPLLDDNGINSKISIHFGHAPYFGLYDFKNKELKIIENNLDHDNLDKSPVDQICENFNPSTVFAQDMGMRAIGFFHSHGVELKTGNYKIVKEVLDNFNELKDLNNSCGH